MNRRDKKQREQQAKKDQLELAGLIALQKLEMKIDHRNAPFHPGYSSTRSSRGVVRRRSKMPALPDQLQRRIDKILFDEQAARENDSG